MSKNKKANYQKINKNTMTANTRNKVNNKPQRLNTEDLYSNFYNSNYLNNTLSTPSRINNKSYISPQNN